MLKPSGQLNLKNSLSSGSGEVDKETLLKHAPKNLPMIDQMIKGSQKGEDL